MEPATGLKATLTSPSRTTVRPHIASGNRPAVASRDTCANTRGAVGAFLSTAISHRGEPPKWVIEIVHPGGVLPTAPSSNGTTTSAAAATTDTRMSVNRIERNQCLKRI